MNPYRFLLPALLGALALLMPAAAQRPRPNIIMVLIDDMGYADLGCFGDPGVRTPNIDRLAREGLRFTRFYVNSPICSPSRTALTTGKYPARWRITSFISDRASNEQRGMAQFLDPSAVTLPRLLKSAGYATGHFGKWHMGGGRDVGEAPLITEYGFDKSLTQFEGLGDRVLPLLDDRDGKPARRLPLGMASEKLGRGHVEWVDRAEVTRSFVDAALGFIRSAERPFYINLWPDDVHSPFFPPADLRKSAGKRALYEAVLVNMDRQLAPLFEAVRADPQLRDNTLILLCSDNGHEEGAGSAGSLRGSKGTLYEGGVRSPLIVWAPGLMPAARRGEKNETALISAVDLVPSLLRIAGRPPGAGDHFDGVDLAGALLGRSQQGRSAPLFWRRPPDRPGPPRQRWPDLAVCEGDWKLLTDPEGERIELFNLSADPEERQNLAAAHPAETARLLALVREWNRSLPADAAAQPQPDLIAAEPACERQLRTAAASTGLTR